MLEYVQFMALLWLALLLTAPVVLGAVLVLAAIAHLTLGRDRG